MSQERTKLLNRSETSINKRSNGDKGKPLKIYPWRWVVLFVFSLNNAICNFIWLASSPIADVMKCYYNISDTILNFLPTTYLIVYPLFVFPAAWALDKYGIRMPTILSSAVMTIGSALRLAGTGSDYFWIVIVGQCIAAFCIPVAFTGGPLLSEVWFPKSERATATAIAAGISPQIGVLFALGIGPILVHSPLTPHVCSNNSTETSQKDVWRDVIYHRLFYYQLGTALVAFLTLILAILCLYNSPPTPPTHSQKQKITHENTANSGFFSGIRKFTSHTLQSLKNKHFVLLLGTSGIMMAAGGAVVTLINEIVTPRFGSDKDTQIGYLGITLQASAFFSMFFIGRILDWTKRYYVMNVLLSVCGTVSIAFLVVIILHFNRYFYLLYPAMVLIGLSVASYQAVAYEYAVEMTYPLPEGTSAALVNTGSQILTILMIFLVTPKLVNFAMWFIVGMTAFGALLAVFTVPKLKRVAVDVGSE